MKKTAIGMLLAVILCFGCGDGNVKENEEKELQTMEETPVQSEAEKSIDSVSTAEPDKKAEETTNVKHDSIDQLEIQGRTQEETELIHKILSADKEEFEEFLTTDWDFPHEQEAIEILAYDFTKDGKDEIIVSKFYLNISAILTYNYVYDCDGRKLMEFVGGHPLEMQIIDDWDGEGSFLLYTMNHYSADNNADIYTEIKYEDDALTEKVVLMELDCRYGGDEGTERYYIFKDFTKEEEEKLWYGSFGVSELAEIKECFKEGEEPEAYRKLFQEREGDLNYFSMISVIVYSEEDGFHEFRNDDETEQIPSELEGEEESLKQWMSKNVWEVNISDPTQEDINRIGDMENLRALSIGTFRVGLDPDIDLRPLTSLRLLQEFAFVGPGGDDVDFSFIRDMPGLSDIYFSKCTAIKDLSLFEDRPELLTLNVSYVDDVDLNKLSGCTQLRDLQITGGHIRNAGGLSDLTHLQHIGLCETQWNEEPSSLLQELCQDSDMTELESLELRHIQVTDISPLVNLQKIQSLRLVDTGIDDIEPLRELKYLTNLEIFGNQSERVKEQAELYFRDIEYLEISEDVPYGL